MNSNDEIKSPVISTIRKINKDLDFNLESYYSYHSLIPVDVKKNNDQGKKSEKLCKTQRKLYRLKYNHTQKINGSPKRSFERLYKSQTKRYQRNKEISIGDTPIVKIINQVSSTKKSLKEKNKNANFVQCFIEKIKKFESKNINSLKNSVEKVSTDNLIKKSDSSFRLIEVGKNENDQSKIIISNLPKNFSKNGKRGELQKMSNVFDSNTFTDDQESDTLGLSIISLHPKTTFKICFDLIIIFGIIYTMIVTPITNGFLIRNNSFLRKIESIVEIFFLCDTIISFFAPFFDEEDNLVTKYSEIFQYNILNHFIIDIITSIPFTLIESFSPNFTVPEFKKYGILKWLRMLCILKLDKKCLSTKIPQINLFEDGKMNRISSFLIQFFIFIHITSSIWIFIGNYNLGLTNSNWIYGNGLSNSNRLDIYIASIYFNLVTVYTVGYGDIVSYNTSERIYNGFFMLCGVLLFTFAISNFSTLVSSNEKKEELLESKLSLLKQIRREHKIEHKLFSSIKKFLKIQSKQSYDERLNLLDLLPPKLKNELTSFMCKDHIKSLAFFNDQNNDFIIYTLPLLKPHKLKKKDKLFSVGEWVEEMYLMTKGRLSLNMGDNYCHIEVCQISENSHFGDIMLNLNEKSPFDLCSKSEFSELLVLKRDDFQKLKSIFKEKIIKILQKSFIQFEMINKRKQVIIEILKIDSNPSSVSKKLLILNQYLMVRDFDDYFKYDAKIEDELEFLMKVDKNDLNKIFKEEPTFQQNESMDTINRNHKQQRINKKWGSDTINNRRNKMRLKTIRKGISDIEENTELNGNLQNTQIARKDSNSSLIIDSGNLANPDESKKTILRNEKIQKSITEENHEKKFFNKPSSDKVLNSKKLTNTFIGTMKKVSYHQNKSKFKNIYKKINIHESFKNLIKEDIQLRDKSKQILKNNAKANNKSLFVLNSQNSSNNNSYKRESFKGHMNSYIIENDSLYSPLKLELTNKNVPKFEIRSNLNFEILSKNQRKCNCYKEHDFMRKDNKRDIHDSKFLKDYNKRSDDEDFIESYKFKNSHSALIEIIKDSLDCEIKLNKNIISNKLEMKNELQLNNFLNEKNNEIKKIQKKSSIWAYQKKNSAKMIENGIDKLKLILKKMKALKKTR